MQHFLQSYHKEKALMANTIFDVLATNQITRGIPIGPSSLAWKIEALLKNIRSLSVEERCHTTTIEPNAAFLDFVSQQTAPKVANFFNQCPGALVLDSGDLFAVLDTLVEYIRTGLEIFLRIKGRGDFEQENYSRAENEVLLLVQKIKDKICHILAEAVLGRPMTDEEELVIMMNRS